MRSHPTTSRPTVAPQSGQPGRQHPATRPALRSPPRNTTRFAKPHPGARPALAKGLSGLDPSPRDSTFATNTSVAPRSTAPAGPPCTHNPRGRPRHAEVSDCQPTWVCTGVRSLPSATTSGLHLRVHPRTGGVAPLRTRQLGHPSPQTSCLRHLVLHLSIPRPRIHSRRAQSGPRTAQPGRQHPATRPASRSPPRNTARLAGRYPATRPTLPNVTPGHDPPWPR
jgi:hypothetical protein